VCRNKEWLTDRAPQLGAALAFYSAFSLVPLLALFVAIFSWVVGSGAAEREVLNTTHMFLGGKVTESVAEILKVSHQGSTSSLTYLGLGTLLFSASGVFGELQSTMNIIWNVPENRSSGVINFLKKRFLSLLMVLGTAFLLLVSLAATTLISTAQNYLWGPSSAETWLVVLNSLLSVTIITAVFGAILKYIPDIDIKWKDIIPGAVFTGVFFEAGKTGIGWYLGRPSVSESFGAAASIIVVLLWVYYSSQILFFGAELTQVFAKRYGSLRTQPIAQSEKV